MIVNDNPRRANHVISGSGPLAFNFGILAASDLQVIQDGILLDPIQYQVTGVGQDGGGTVILATAPADGTQVVILGDQPYKQTSVYTTEAFPPQRIQNDFNKVVIGQQQMLEVLNRTPRFAKESLLVIPEIPEPTAVDLFLRVAALDPLAVDWGTLAVLAGAVGIPLAFSNGGTGANYADASAMLQGIGAARWASFFATPTSGLITLPNPLTGNRVAVDAGAINSISTSGILPGTQLIFDYITGGNFITDSVNLQLQGRTNYTTVIGDRSIFYFNGVNWSEIFRSPNILLSNATKFLRGDGTWQNVAVLVPTGVSKGLTLANNATDPSNDIDIAPGDAFSDEADPALRVQMSTSSIFVKQLDNDWVAGSGNGGRVFGQTLTNTTWHVFMFRLPSGAIDFCFSNNLVFVTPGSGTNRVHIMSILREAGGIVQFKQVGDWIEFNLPTIQFDSPANPGASFSIPTPVRTPLGMRCMVRYIFQLRTSGIAVVALTAQMQTADQPPALDVAPLYNVGLVNANHLTTVRQLDTMSDTLGQIRVRLNASDAGTKFRVVTIGYFHPRGKQ